MHLVHGVPPDYMHCVLEGVVKACLKLWTESQYRKQPYSVRHSLADIDRLLLEQRPPHEFTRPPRSIVSQLS